MSPITRTFTRAELDTLDLPGAWADDAPEILHREQVETRRWVSVNELIFRAPDDNKPYRVHYEEGLTEVQEDHDPWNYDDTVTATLMEQHETTVTQWREVDSDRAEEQPTGTQAVPVLSDSVRQFLTFALDLAADAVASSGDEFDADEEAALEALRRIAEGAEQTPAPYEPTAAYVVEIHNDGHWHPISRRRDTLKPAQERRDVYRRRHPDAGLRIVRWDETATVVETDEEQGR